MSTIDANRVIFTGENSAIRLSNNDSDSFTTNATFWRAVSSGAGSGHVLYLKSELTEARWRIYSDNIAMARLLQSTVLGAIYAELLDPTIAVIDAQFSRSGDVRDFWTERLVTCDEEVAFVPGMRWASRSWFIPNPMLFQGAPMECARCLCRRSARGSPTTGLRPKVGLGRGNAKAIPRVPASWVYARAGPRLDSVRFQTAEFGCDVCQRRRPGEWRSHDKRAVTTRTE